MNRRFIKVEYKKVKLGNNVSKEDYDKACNEVIEKLEREGLLKKAGDKL